MAAGWHLAKWFLSPFALGFFVLTQVRNWLYDKGFFKSVSFGLPVICVGNLSVGGSGKTPHVEHLIKLLSPYLKVAVLSRGYGRKSKGFVWADQHSTPKTIGDEPFMYWSKYNIAVGVCEKRVEGVNRILSLQPDIQVILMDDGFQHRSIRPSLSLVLTQYDKPFFKDFLMPLGRLRESAKSISRSDAVLVTKCIEPIEKKEFKKRIAKPTYFSKTCYFDPKNTAGQSLEKGREVILVSGLANPSPFVEQAGKHFKIVENLIYPDHHDYTAKELAKLTNKPYPILTSEKDFVKLRTLGNKIYFLPIGVEISEGFDELVFNHIKKFYSF